MSWVPRGSEQFNGTSAFGWSVALSSNGNIMAVGGPEYAVSKGCVKVYEWNGTDWSPKGSTIFGDNLGENVGVFLCLSGDGLTFATKFNSVLLLTERVKVYRWDGGDWAQIGNDITDLIADNTKFGEALSLSPTGNTIAIGAPYGATNGLQSGYVGIYDYSPNVWTQWGLNINGANIGDTFGNSVSLPDDGITVAIGAPQLFLPLSEGYTKVYFRDVLPAGWTIKGLPIIGETAGESSGFVVSLASDGNTLAISAPFNNDNGPGSGQVRVY